MHGKKNQSFLEEAPEDVLTSSQKTNISHFHPNKNSSSQSSHQESATKAFSNSSEEICNLDDLVQLACFTLGDEDSRQLKSY